MIKKEESGKTFFSASILQNQCEFFTTNCLLEDKIICGQQNQDKISSQFYKPLCWEERGYKEITSMKKKFPSLLKHKNILTKPVIDSFKNSVLNIVVLWFRTIILNLLSNMIWIITQLQSGQRSIYYLVSAEREPGLFLRNYEAKPTKFSTLDKMFL